jgi:hypothetical protein
MTRNEQFTSFWIGCLLLPPFTYYNATFATRALNDTSAGYFMLHL